MPNQRLNPPARGGVDLYDFDLAGQRRLGMRYAQQMIAALGL